jgi:hypothetical protein
MKRMLGRGGEGDCALEERPRAVAAAVVLRNCRRFINDYPVK